MRKTLSILLIAVMLLGCFAALIPQSKAFSDAILSLTYGVDTNDGHYLYVNNHHIFALDQQLAFYDNNAVLETQYTVPAFSFSDDGLYIGASYRTSILPWNTTAILVFSSGLTFLHYGLAGISTDNSRHTIGVAYQTFLLNTETRANQTLAYGYTNSTKANSGYNDTAGWETYVHSQAFLALNNGTYQNYYAVIGADGASFYSTNTYEGKLNLYVKVAYCLNADIGISLSGLNSKLTVSGTTETLFNSPITVPSRTSSNEAYVISGSAYQNLRFNVIKLTDSALTLLGTSGTDYTYGGNYWYNTGLHAYTYYVGFVFNIGTYYYNGTTNALYEINIAYNYRYATQMAVETILFNDTYISQTKASMGAIYTSSYFAMPYTVAIPTGGANVSGVYGIAFWSDINAHNGLTEWDVTLSGIETGNPAWSSTGYGSIFNPSHPQIFNYSSATNQRGFQPLGANVGIEIYGAWTSYTVQGSMVAQLFGEISPTGGGGGTGGDSGSASYYYILQVKGAATPYIDWVTIQDYPSWVNLWQLETYHVKGFVYLNGTIRGTGNFTLLLTPLSTDVQVLNYSSPDYTFAVAGTGTVTNGQFSFTLAPRDGGNSSGIVYQGLMVNIELEETPDVLLTDAYYIIWWGHDTGMIPGGYPPITPTGGTVSDVTWVNYAVLFTIIGAPALLLGGAAGLPGLIIGAIIGLGAGTLAGLVPLWFIILLGAGVVTVLLMWRRNNGQG